MEWCRFVTYLSNDSRIWRWIQ